jgi:prophage tail gpP-like protein
VTTRIKEEIRVVTDSQELTLFDTIDVRHDLTKPSEAVLTIGDEGSAEDLAAIVAPGSSWKVYVSGCLQLTGRGEVLEIDGGSDRGVGVRLTIRTKLSDAMATSADPKTKTTGVTLKQFILDLFEPLGFKEDDFAFGQEVARDLLTGKSTAKNNRPADLVPIQPAQAKINWGETVYEVAQKHLARHHMALWDSPSGKIVIAAPDQNQPPLYKLRAKRQDADANNIGAYKKIRDWTSIPAWIWVYGGMQGTDVAKSGIKGMAELYEVQETAARTGHFARKVTLHVATAKDSAQAEGIAKREMAKAARQFDAWDFLMDGWSFFDGNGQFPYAIDTMADVDVDTVGGPSGSYMLHRVAMHFDRTRGFGTTLSTVKKGLWVL